MVESRTVNAVVAGSSPASGAISPSSGAAEQRRQQTVNLPHQKHRRCESYPDDHCGCRQTGHSHLPFTEESGGSSPLTHAISCLHRIAGLVHMVLSHITWVRIPMEMPFFHGTVGQLSESLA